MGQLVESIFDSFTAVITGLSGGLSEAFSRLLYVYSDGVATTQFNPLIQFIFTMAGVGLAAAILWRIFGLLRGASHRAG